MRDQEQTAFSDCYLMNRGRELVNQIHDEQPSEIKLSAEDCLAVKCVSTPKEWLAHQKAGHPHGKIGKTVIHKA